MFLQFSGQVMLHQEDWEKGQAALLESLVFLREIESAAFIAAYLEELGRVVTVVGQSAWAAHLWGAVETFRISNALPSTSEGKETRRLHIQLPALSAITTTLEEAVDTVRSQLGEAFAAAWNEGRAMTLEQALAMQVQTIVPKRLPSSMSVRSDHQEMPSSTYPGELTRREIEVLRLVAAGLTDAQVAEELVVSPRTVNAHVRSILSKLNVTSRNAATRYAIANKLI
jgi:DNA-binding NarL/FixJ family response regulator